MSRLEYIYSNAVADDALDQRFGFERVTTGPARLGWLLNMQPVSTSGVCCSASLQHQTVVKDGDSGRIKSAVDYYFMEVPTIFMTTRHVAPTLLPDMILPCTSTDAWCRRTVADSR